MTVETGNLTEVNKWAKLKNGHWVAGSSFDAPHFIYKAEHVERYSGRLLSTLHQLFQLNVVAQDEVFAASVCDALSWCKNRSISQDGFQGT
jgi:hypothetical protein